MKKIKAKKKKTQKTVYMSVMAIFSCQVLQGRYTYY